MMCGAKRSASTSKVAYVSNTPGRTGRRVLTLCLLLLLVSLGVTGSVLAGPVTYPDREATYPAGVLNVTHEPWSPRTGDDVRVTLRMAPDAEIPAQVSIIFCRVEPTYVCGIPFFIDASDDKRVWSGTIEWDERFMRSETVHVGYNLTLRYLDRDTGMVQRVAAPMGNHWVPDGFPSDGGDYYFFAYRDAGVFGSLPAPMPAILLLFGIFVVGLLRRDGSRRREDRG